MALNAVDFHCHGVGSFDFTEVTKLNLDEIEATLACYQHCSILTLYLHQTDFEHFIRLMKRFSQEKDRGRYQHIAGFGLEGPLLGSIGGTPKSTVWVPNKQQWQQLAECGQYGLSYIILSPDVVLPSYANSNNLTLPWIIETLLSGDVLPAAGHFNKNDPKASASALQTIFDIVAHHGKVTITDHLFNDMPLNFKHAWRTPQEKAMRDEAIESLKLDSWTLDNLSEKLGPVPATMIRYARQGHVKICQNFDGEHVDLAIVKKAVELIGAENMLMMTDSIESHRLAGRMLHFKTGSTLLYQEDDIVAAGSQTVYQQISNMLSIGLTEQEIKLITHDNPEIVLKQQEMLLL